MKALAETLNAPTLDQIRRLQAEMSTMPQAQLETKHYFADGMYARELHRPAGTLIVGKVHKREHFFVITKGRIMVSTAEGMRECPAGTVIVSQPGTKRVTLALEDSVATTFHRTDSRDLDAIEAEIIEPDENALFDARNQLKALPGAETQEKLV